MTVAAIGQITSTSSLEHNLSQCLHLIRLASARNATALFLPEASDYIASSASESISLCQPLTVSPFVVGIQAAAKQHSLPISVGVHEPAEDGKKIRNVLLWINAQGEIEHKYQKLHLFDVSIANGPQLQESANVEKGPRIEDPIDTPLGKLGMLICFDLRFPEPSLALRKRGAQVLVYPSAFTVPTGEAHWEVLLRARAIENQAYVVAAAQVGSHDEAGKRRSYGHSMVVDPWGRVVVNLGGCESMADPNDGHESGHKEGQGKGNIAFVDVDLGLVEKVRREVPLVRRTDVYPEIV